MDGRQNSGLNDIETYLTIDTKLGKLKRHLAQSYPSSEQVQLLIMPESEEKVPRRDPRSVIVSCSVASQLEHLGGEILQDCSEVNCGIFAHSL